MTNVANRGGYATWRNNPYELIREFWGYDLDDDLASRIAQAPEEHMDEFSAFLMERPTGVDLPPLQDGHLRPVLTANAADDLTGQGMKRLVSVAPVLLLYSHEIVMDDPIDLVLDDDYDSRNLGLTWLQRTRPLFEAGAIHYKPVSSQKRHPSRSLLYADPDVVKSVLEMRQPDVRDFISRYTPSDSPRDAVEAARLLLRDVAWHVSYGEANSGRVHKLFRSVAEQVVFRHILSAAGPYIDSRETSLSKLASLAVPSFKPELTSLVAIRESGESFAEWRSQLGIALRQLDAAQIGVDGLSSVLLANVRGELEPITEKLYRASKQSPVLSALQTGLKGFGLSAVAAGAGFAVGGNPASALAGAVAAKTVEGVANYYNARRRERRNRAVLELAASFTTDSD